MKRRSGQPARQRRLRAGLPPMSGDRSTTSGRWSPSSRSGRSGRRSSEPRPGRDGGLTMTTNHVTLTVNGEAREADVEPRLLLVHLLRDVFGLTGTHIGCVTSNCGACTVHVDGRSAKSCTMLAVQADGAEVRTIEGMVDGATLHPLQQAFWDQHGLQCGFCTPGMIMQAAWLLEQNPDPTEAEIREGIAGNLCRCTGYVNIVKSIQQAAGTLRAEDSAPVVAEETIA